MHASPPATEDEMRIETTGTYVDGKGNSFWYRAGDRAPDGLTLRPGLSKAGAPENRAIAPAENRAEATAEPAIVKAPRKRKAAEDAG